MRDAGCNLLTDALVDHSLTNCTSTFNFESGIQGAVIVGSGTAFQNLIKTTTPTYCGMGALAITAQFSGTTGPTTKGEVDLPLVTDAGLTENLNGKTITVHISANPACDPGLKLTVVVITAAGTQVLPLRNVPLTANWTSASATLSADGGTDTAIKIALDVSSFSGYQGTIYIDEVNIR